VKIVESSTVPGKLQQEKAGVLAALR